MKTKKDSTEKKYKTQTDASQESPADQEVSSNDASLTQELSRLREALEAREKESRENYERYLRAVADTENIKKRALRDKADTIKYGKEDIIKDILPFLDSLDRALEHEGATDAQAFKDGIALIQDQLLCCLKKHGVERIESAGAAFDPNFHEALMQVDSADHEHNQVVSEVEKGYLLNGRLIRPSRVCVCKR